MENNQKRGLLNLSYYALIAAGILFSVLFLIRVANTELSFIIQVIYYIWSAALILNLIFDVYCTMKHRMKYICGLIFFVLAILAVIMGIVVFISQGLSITLLTILEYTYFINIFLCFTPLVIGIYAYLFGQKIINFED